MSSGSSSALPPQASAVIDAFAAGIRPAIGLIMTTTIFASMLIPITIALFYFSTPESRKRPVFLLNVCALCMGLIAGVLTTHVLITDILSPFKGARVSEALAFNVFLIWTPFFSEAILIIRLLAVFQSRTKTQLVALLIFPVAIKCVRAGVYIKWLQFQHLANTNNPSDPSASDKMLQPWIPKLGYTAELCDNLYVSGMFLFKLYQRGHISDRRLLGASISSFGRKVRTLFWIAATSFVFPVVLGICEVTIAFTTGNIVTTGLINVASLYLVLISTVCATLWSQSLAHGETETTQVPSLQLDFAPPSSTRTERLSVVHIPPTVSSKKENLSHSNSNYSLRSL